MPATLAGSNNATASRIFATTSTPRGQRGAQAPHSVHAEAKRGLADDRGDGPPGLAVHIFQTDADGAGIKAGAAQGGVLH